MSKALVFIIGLGVVALGVWWWVDSQSSLGDEKMMESESMIKPSEEKAMMDSESKTEATDTTDKKSDSMMEKGERYVAYTKDNLEKYKEARRVLFFYASWCPFCKPADAEFEEKMIEIPSDVRVIRVNYNDPDTDQEEKDLAQKYGVTYQHTFVQIDGEGQAVTKWNGGKMAELLKNIK